MASVTPKKFGQGNIATTPGTLVYTAPTGISSIVKCIDICNTTGGAITVSVYLVPSGDTAAAANALFYTISVASNGTYQWLGTQVLDAGGFIQAIASATGCTINVGGGEYST